MDALKKWMFILFTKTFVQIILATEWLVQHSSTSPKQQRRPLPSLLSSSFFYGGRGLVYPRVSDPNKTILLGIVNHR